MAWFGRQPAATPTIDSLRLYASDWKYLGEREPGRMRLWETPDGDAVILHFFAKAPDLPTFAKAGDVRSFYLAQLGTTKAKLVNCGIIQVAMQPAVMLTIKVPQTPSGMMYQGVFTIPFRDFSFVIKVQSPESGTTGVREAVLTQRRLAAGEVPKLGGSGAIFPGWDPDAVAYDKDFPKHPVSRLRRVLKGISLSASLDESVRRLSPFPLPGSAQ
jgi:hypothetical protein